MTTTTTHTRPPLRIQVTDAQVAPPGAAARRSSPPRADSVVSMLRSLTVDGDYFERRALRSTCIQKTPLDDFHPQFSEIVPGLFVADIYTATSVAVIRGLGITHVVSVLKHDCPRFSRNIKHICVPIDDSLSAELLGHLDFMVDWIKRALSHGGQVMVHCVWGMSRSASIAIAFLMATRRISLDDALKYTVSKRKVVRPNSGFLRQLKVYERILLAREEKLKRIQRMFEHMAARPEWR